MYPNPLVLKNLTIDPPLFCAPMAGVTHSAFRRLVAGFGGYGALFTEMLSGKALLHEKIGATPFTKKRDCEGIVWFQLALSGEEDIAAIIDALQAARPSALDINAACPAPEILPRGYGAALFRDRARFTQAIVSVRRPWKGVLTVKCRLGDDEPGWQEKLVERLKIMEDEGVDAVFVHPRFFNEKLKRRARWELFEWIASITTLPVIGNGDIVSAQQVRDQSSSLNHVAGLMAGRMAIVKPWIFSEITGNCAAIDYAHVWKNLFSYVVDDFPPEKAIGRIKEFTKYFAQNFMFGHEFYRAVQTASSLEMIGEKALGFLEAKPALTNYPTVAGL
jgi:tRNA-dihydrouridine synthase